MADIFLSYARDDDVSAGRLERALEAAGWTVFRDHELVPGHGFRDAIARELEAAACVVVLWSRVSVTRPFVLDEADTGLQRARLLSVVIDQAVPPLGFRQTQLADLRGWDGDPGHAGFARLVQGISAFVRPGFAPTTPDSTLDRTLKPISTFESTPGPVKPPPPPRRRHPALAPTLLVAAIFGVNLAQTSADSWLTPAALGAEAGYPVADAFRWFEGFLSFDAHDTIGHTAVVGYSVSYFLLLPLLALFVAIHLLRHPDHRPYRALCLAVAIDYAVSLPFFLFFPVPERWFFPDTGAILLSDRWSDALIEAIRPMSGLDNSFPSFHVSLTTLLATASVLFGVPLRASVLALGATIVLSTFALGIHWIPDILAGFALGIASMLLAWRVTRGGTAAVRSAPAGLQASGVHA